MQEKYLDSCRFCYMDVTFTKALKEIVVLFYSLFSGNDVPSALILSIDEFVMNVCKHICILHGSDDSSS